MLTPFTSLDEITVSAAYMKSIIKRVEPGRPIEKKFGPHVLTITLIISWREKKYTYNFVANKNNRQQLF